MSAREPDESRTSPLRRPVWMASAVLLVGVLVVGALTLFWPDDDPGPDEPTPTQADPSSSQSEQPTAGDDESICGLEPGDQTVPTEPPTDATWTLYGTFAAPSIEGVGPGLTADDGLRHCFAPSPTGALLAAVNYWAMSSLDPTFVGDDRLLVDNAAAESLRDQLAEEGSRGAPPFQLAAFSYRGEPSAESTVVDLVFAEVGSDTHLLVPMPMVWEDGDWQFELPPTGDTGQRVIDSLNGYVPWSGIA